MDKSLDNFGNRQITATGILPTAMLKCVMQIWINAVGTLLAIIVCKVLPPRVAQK